MPEFIADMILIVILILIIGAALLYIKKEKKKGIRCIGCPQAGTCPRSCASKALPGKKEKGKGVKIS